MGRLGPPDFWPSFGAFRGDTLMRCFSRRQNTCHGYVFSFGHALSGTERKLAVDFRQFSPKSVHYVGDR
jgi:hypothetical protein